MASSSTTITTMPADLFMAATQGNNEFFVQHLGLLAEEQNHAKDKVTIEDKNLVQYTLECATSFGETILHILVANGHNELAKNVIQKNASLLKAQDKHLQTPLHYAAKAGNVEIIRDLIRLVHDEVMNALKETDDNGDTSLHLAIKHGHLNVVGQLLEFDSSLAYTRFSDGMFPIHVAARIGNTNLVRHLLENTDSANLREQHGRTFFHVAAEENKIKVLTETYNFNDVNFEMMLRTRDYDGNTPLHIAAMKGHVQIMIVLWGRSRSFGFDSSTEPNNHDQTPFDLSEFQLSETIYKGREYKINAYIQKYGRQFTIEWFCDIMILAKETNYWEKSQVIGLGSVLIATVAFAAAFTVPGGYNADYGTPILGRRFMYRAFTYANALAFVQAFVSVLVLVAASALGELTGHIIKCSSFAFISAANCMVLSFGAGSYVMLAQVNLPTAIIILILALIAASPLLGEIDKAIGALKGMGVKLDQKTAFIGWYVLPFVLVFCLAFVK